MARPPSIYDKDSRQGVYDDEEQAEQINRLRELSNAGDEEASDDETGSPADPQSSPQENSLSPEQLNNREQKAAGGSGNNTGPPETQNKNEDPNFAYRPTKFRSKNARRRRKLLMFGGAGAALLGGGAGLVLFLLPNLAIKHVMNTIKSGLNDRIEYAVQTRAEKYIEKYMHTVITPSLNSCGTAISKDCVAVNTGTGLMGRMFANWRDNRIEEKLFNRFDLEFKKDLRDPNRIEVFHKGKLVGNSGSRSTVKEVLKFTDQLNQAPNVRERWIIRSLLDRKYGAKKWCIIACKKRDAVADLKISFVRKIKLKIIAWIIQPISERKATYLMCFVVNCGGGKDAIDKLASKAADRIVSNVEGDTLKLIASEIEGKTISRYLTEKAVNTIVSKIAGQAAGEAAASSVPVAGQLYLAAVLADMLDRLDTAIANKELTNYVREVNKSAYANYFGLFNTLDDDIQSGEALTEDIGGAIELVDGFDRSRLYQKMTGSTNLGSVPCEKTVISGPDGPLACPEKQVQPVFFLEEWRNSDIGIQIAGVINAYGRCYGSELPGGRCLGLRPRNVIRPALGAINYVLAGVANTLLGALNYIPGLNGFLDNVTATLSNNAFDLFTYLMKKVFPEVINGDAQGQEVFDQIAAGGDVTYNSFAKGEETEDGFIGLGALNVSEQEQAVLDTKIAEQNAQEWKDKSIFARYLDINNPRSFAGSAATNLAFTIPRIKKGAISFNIFSSLSSIINSTLSPKTHAAVLTNRGEIFGVTQYAFPIDDIALTIDPESLTDEACATYKAARENSKITDPDTGEIIYTVSDPCALDQVVTDSMTKFFNLDPVGAQ